MDPSRSRSCATTLVLVRGDTQTNRGRSFLPMLAQETAALRDLGLANVRFGAKSSRSVTTEPCPLYRPKADKRERSPNVRFVPIAAVSNRSKKNYSITSSAATSSPGGTVRPSARSETGRQISC